ncbi:MAG: hypothetical protein D6709_10540 [Chloroflexi bacterium]|jgi:hypothetical protein|uniref:Uncharacterized protein n=1 Tax=Candidatus Thermofonsia Clade 3 bacterium TaxID=2364212 RepID=A0A2M8QGX1_9CHLR|nr:hypothetical protein [Candidatus Roseilinea sp. NK_OTU-006]PJF49046.1 MAG: hypothetical protein CUN48_00070 [Candidatus Thermofonsia Clade 3 bacterium]RMG62697.1 MAG: hypothetical protein D6709_10540 [Chloroflexota bacterium]
MAKATARSSPLWYAAIHSEHIAGLILDGAVDLTLDGIQFARDTARVQRRAAGNVEGLQREARRRTQAAPTCHRLQRLVATTRRWRGCSALR